MKKLTSTALVMAIVVTSAMATDPDRSTSTEANASIETVSLDMVDGKVNLKVLDEDRGKVDVTIRKIEGSKIFDETIAYAKSFTKPFDMTNQEAGSYVFEVEGEGINFEQEVFISDLHEEDVYATISELDGDKINIKVLHEKVPVTIRIADENGQLLFKETYDMLNNFQQQFDLQELGSQSVQVMISGKKSFITKRI